MRYRVEKREQEVLRFVTTPASYTAYLESGLRLDIARCRPLQQVDSPASFLWLETVQGYFVLRQSLDEGRLGPWLVLFELQPDSSDKGFFSWIEEHFFASLPSWMARDGMQQPPLELEDAGVLGGGAQPPLELEEPEC